MIARHDIETFAANNTNMSDFDRLVHLQWAVFSVISAGIEGAFVEVGCNAGKTSAFFGHLLRHFDQSERSLHLFDSFSGLPAPSVHDAYLKEGELPASPDDVLLEFARWNLPSPAIHKGWFEQTLPQSLPEKVAFCYLDADFYLSTKHALSAIYPRMTKGGLLIVDDYADEERNPQAWNVLGGVKRACDEVLTDKREQMMVLCATNDLAFGLLRKA